MTTTEDIPPVPEEKPGRRWALFSGIDIGEERDPYLDRLWLVKTPLGGIALHHIHRADAEPDPHDHQWGFFRLILCGGYAEGYWPDKRNPDRYRRRTLRRGSLGWMGRRSAHTILEVTGPLWTLVATGPKLSTWGFWHKGQFIDHADYQYQPSRQAAPRA
jgi:hypothetical protein